MTRRILFVDDDPQVLSGLRRTLIDKSDEWEVAFAPSGPDALALLEQETFDAIVSDMRMPGMDGAELLTQVRDRHPDTVRLVLSGQSDKEMILKSVGPTHQFLSKPCDNELLIETLSRACALRDVLSSQSISRLILQLDSLPSLPNVYVELTAELESPNSSVENVAKIISRDMGMTAKILQLVNSGFFGLPRRIGDPAQAVVLLGFETIRALVLSVHVFAPMDQTRVEGFSVEQLREHSIACGALAKYIASSQKQGKEAIDAALMAGLLHDVGKLVFVASLPQEYAQALEQATREQVPLQEVERRSFGATHAEVGAYLLRLWGIPDPVVEAVAFHHEPRKCAARKFAGMTAVHVANALEHQYGNRHHSGPVSTVDQTYLHELGLADALANWEKRAQETLPCTGAV